MVVVAVHTTQFHVPTVNFEHFSYRFHLLHPKVVGEVFIVLGVFIP